LPAMAGLSASDGHKERCSSDADNGLSICEAIVTKYYIGGLLLFTGSFWKMYSEILGMSELLGECLGLEYFLNVEMFAERCCSHFCHGYGILCKVRLD
jgi:hypothetical protein